jgi:hypothetical protein
MSRRLKRLGSQTAACLSLYISGRTPRHEIQDFVAKLVPHDLGVPLCRIGGQGDGGYIVPDDLEGIASCFSPGVADTANFELELYHRGVNSFLADYSVDGPPPALPACDFTKKFVGAFDSPQAMTLDHWVSSKAPNRDAGDLILQMDIESAEYETLLATSDDTLSRFRIIVLELHKLHHLDNPLFHRFANAMLGKLLNQFEVAHIHANNAKPLSILSGVEVPPLLELTLLRKDRVKSKSAVSEFPHRLDVINVPSRPEVRLPNYWYQPGQLNRAA